ncbi:hypothetical protein [Sphingomonas antarctica]|uniref:hypothetical protein n=1 Tax=Sphingomonas antarctica TaxID=2040274 RepID=UPI0039E87412
MSITGAALALTTGRTAASCTRVLSVHWKEPAEVTAATEQVKAIKNIPAQRLADRFGRM